MKALSNALVTPPFQTCPRPAITAVSTDQDAPAGIDIDPDRRAFLRARLNLLAFPQLKAEVAKGVPPARRARKSAIHAWWIWWIKHRDATAVKSQPDQTAPSPALAVSSPLKTNVRPDEY